MSQVGNTASSSGKRRNGTLTLRVVRASTVVSRSEKGGSRTRYTVYTIECQMDMIVWECTRRYSHFEKLYECLREVYKLNSSRIRMLLTSIGLGEEAKKWTFPGKSARSLSDRVVQERIQGLDLFVRALCADHAIVASAEILTFVGALIEKGTKQVAEEFEQPWSELDIYPSMSVPLVDSHEVGTERRFRDQALNPVIRREVGHAEGNLLSSASTDDVPSEWLLPFSPVVDAQMSMHLLVENLSALDVKSGTSETYPARDSGGEGISSLEVGESGVTGCIIESLDHTTSPFHSDAYSPQNEHFDSHALKLKHDGDSQSTSSPEQESKILTPEGLTKAATPLSLMYGIDASNALAEDSSRNIKKEANQNGPTKGNNLKRAAEGRKYYGPVQGEITPAKLFQLARPGDVLLIRNSSSALGTIQRALTGSRYDHVALLTSVPPSSRPSPRNLCVLEATLAHGVRLLPLGHWLEQMLKNGHTIALRRLHGCQRNTQQLQNLEAFERSVEGLKYSVSGALNTEQRIQKHSLWLKSQGTFSSKLSAIEQFTSSLPPTTQKGLDDISSVEQSGYFCSELVHHALMALGAAESSESGDESKSRKSHIIMPVHFQAISTTAHLLTKSSSGSPHKHQSRENTDFFQNNCVTSDALNLSEGICFGPELVIRQRRSGIPLQHARVMRAYSEENPLPHFFPSPTSNVDASCKVIDDTIYPLEEVLSDAFLMDVDDIQTTNVLSTTPGDESMKDTVSSLRSNSPAGLDPSNSSGETCSGDAISQEELRIMRIHRQMRSASMSNSIDALGDDGGECLNNFTSHEDEDANPKNRKLYALLGPEAAQYHTLNANQHVTHPQTHSSSPTHIVTPSPLSNAASSPPGEMSPQSTSSCPLVTDSSEQNCWPSSLMPSLRSNRTRLFDCVEPNSLAEHVTYFKPVDTVIEYYFV